MSNSDVNSPPTSMYRYTHGVDRHVHVKGAETVVAPPPSETGLEEHLKSVYRWSWDVNSNPVRAQRQQDVTIGRSEPDDMPTPTTLSNEGRHAKGPPTEKKSKFSQIMNCIFGTKTEVVDMKTEAEKSATKKQTVLVDRSERSRRVLKMESRKEAPKTRDINGIIRQTSPTSSRRFLPSENPSAALMTYLTPQNRALRRACSEQVRSTSTSLNKPLAREAFNRSNMTLTRNTDYRANRATERTNHNGKPVDGSRISPENAGTSTLGRRKHTKAHSAVVPGVMGADEEVYNSDDEIHDLHDEMARMNMRHPDLQNFPDERENGEPNGSLIREGDVSMSKVGDPGAEDRSQLPAGKQARKFEDYEGNRIHRIPTALALDRNDTNDPDNTTMEEVIDYMYTQTQQNLDNIYRTGIESIESISQSATPDMDKFEAQYMHSNLVNENVTDKHKTVTHSNSVRNNSASATNLTTDSNHKCAQPSATKQQSENSSEHMDSLLDDVSDWAKDRQNWLLDQPNDEKYGTESDICIDAVMQANSETAGSGRHSNRHSGSQGRESVSTFNPASVVDFDRMGAANPMMKVAGNADSANGRRFVGPRESTEQKCNKWVESQTDDPKIVGGILTGAKLFRSASRGGEKASMDNIHKMDPESGNDGAYNTLPIQVPSKRTYRGVQIIDYSDTTAHDAYPIVKHIEKNDKGIASWTNEIHRSTPRTTDDRLTINESPSDLGDAVPFRARSPDSWISSCVSPTFMTKVSRKSNAEDLDTFDTDSFDRRRPAIRRTPKIHRGLEREATPMTGDSIFFPVQKHSQNNPPLGPLHISSVMREPRRSDSLSRTENTTSNINDMDSLSNLPSLPTLRKDDVLATMIKHTEHEQYNNPRPFSDIPVRPKESGIMNKASHSPRNSDPNRNGIEVGSEFMTDSRPTSEKLAPKRAESLRVGMGNIMSTDSGNKDRSRSTAKQFGNLIEKQGVQQHHSFSISDKNTGHASVTNIEPKHNVFESASIAGGAKEDKLTRTSSIHSKHGLQTRSPGFPPIPQTMKMQSAEQDGMQNTAERFKKLRGRRDQEISWMMKDAAETEV